VLYCGRLSQGTIVAFGLTAPLFNPMSVLYGLTLSDPIAILTFSLCAMVIVSLLGFAWNRIVKVDDEAIIDEATPSSGIKRTISVFDSTSRALVGPMLGYLAIGIFFSVFLAVALPKGQLQNQVDHDSMVAPIVVAAVATPIYGDEPDWWNVSARQLNWWCVFSVSSWGGNKLWSTCLVWANLWAEAICDIFCVVGFGNRLTGLLDRQAALSQRR